MPTAQPNDRSLLLWPGQPPASAPGDSFRPWLTPYLAPGNTGRRGCVVVCPGGGYGGRAPHESAPIAERLNQAGIHAVTLQYRVAPNRHPAPLFDAARAVRLVRHHATTWGVDPTKVAVLGYSAGGHLTGSIGVHYPDATPPNPDAIDQLPCRPDAIVPCYPVLSGGEFAHQGSFENLLGKPVPPAMRQYMSLEQDVTPQTPPTFLWHTADDGAVPVENSLLFATALRRHRVPFELHVYPTGAHGLGLAPAHANIATWMPLCITWLTGMGW